MLADPVLEFSNEFWIEARKSAILFRD